MQGWKECANPTQRSTGSSQTRSRARQIAKGGQKPPSLSDMDHQDFKSMSCNSSLEREDAWLLNFSSWTILAVVCEEQKFNPSQPSSLTVRVVLTPEQPSTPLLFAALCNLPCWDVSCPFWGHLSCLDNFYSSLFTLPSHLTICSGPPMKHRCYYRRGHVSLLAESSQCMSPP